MVTAFISHSTKDSAFVEQEMIPLLESLGITPWYSPQAINLAAAWERSIREALVRSDWVVVMLSPNAVQSEWVRAEVHWALENKVGRVLPVTINPCDPSELHIKLAGIQHADYTSDFPAARVRLAALFGCTSSAITTDSVQDEDTEPAGGLTKRAPLSGDMEAVVTEIDAIGKYDLLRVLAKTGSGMTFVARQRTVKHDVLMKSYELPSASPNDIVSVVTEIQQRSRLRHPLLVTPMEVIPARNRLFVVTQYLTDVKSTTELLHLEGPLPAGTACRILSQVSLGLSHAHAMGISHQFLDSWDILVDSHDHTVRIAGFEKAPIRNYYNTTGLHTVVGTLQYTSPEISNGEPLDCATDVHHVGLILCALLTGTVPSIKQRRIDLNSVQVRLDRVAGRTLTALCLKCLQEKKADRFADATELFDAFLSVKEKKRWWHLWN
jgi:Protein kinase domain/TIR domain